MAQREMLLLELIEQYSPVYPEGASWQETAEYLYSEEPELMAELTASLATEGWRQPILLSEPEDLEEGDSPRVLNGTHRVSIALREGIISVPVTTASEQGDYEEPEAVAVLTVLLQSGVLNEDEDFAIFDVLRSFELDRERWANSDFSFGSHDRWLLYYDDIQSETDLPLLKRKARARLKKFLPEYSFKLTAELQASEAEDGEPER